MSVLFCFGCDRYIDTDYGDNHDFTSPEFMCGDCVEEQELQNAQAQLAQEELHGC